MRVTTLTFLRNFGMFVCIALSVHASARDCTNYSHLCGVYATCQDTEADIVCLCKKGFTPGGYVPPMPSNCLDINECDTNTLHECVNQAACINTVGSYNCTCPDGYYAIGLNASGRLECEACNRSDGVSHMFGFNCSQPCTCATGAFCAGDTGICTGNSCGDETSPLTCDKNDLKVTVTTVAVNNEVTEGLGFQVTCSVNLLPADFTLSWTGPNGDITGDLMKYTLLPITVGSNSSPSSQLLIVSIADSTDSGMYTCTATLVKATRNVTSDTDSVAITVLVQGKIVSELPEEKRGVNGSNFTLTCEAFGNPIPSVQWLFNKTLANNAFTNAEQFVSQGTNDMKRIANLNFYNLSKTNGGIYTCQVKVNSDETDSRDVTLIVVDLPQIADLQVISTTSISLVLSWTITDSGSDTLKCRAMYIADGSTEDKVKNCLSNTTCWLTSLFPYTMYSVTVKCSNTAGDSNPLNISKRTNSSAPSAPRNPNVEDGRDKCVVMWDASEFANGPGLHYEVTQFIRHASLGDEDSDTEDVGSTMQYELQKADMELNSIYTFKICANNDDHRGSCVNPSESCMTNPGAPDEIPSIEVLDQDTAVSSNSVTLTVPDIDDRNGPISCYEFVVVKSAGSGGGSPNDDVPFEEVKCVPDQNDSPYRSVVMNHVEYMTSDTLIIGSVSETVVTICTLESSSNNRRKRRSNMVEGVDKLNATNAPLESGTSYDIFMRSYSETSDGMFQYTSSDYVKVTTADRDGGGASAGLIVFLILLILIIIIISMVIFAVWFRRTQKKEEQNMGSYVTYANEGSLQGLSSSNSKSNDSTGYEETSGNETHEGKQEEEVSCEGVIYEEMPEDSNTYDQAVYVTDEAPLPFKVSELPNYVNKKRYQKNGLEREFKLLPQGQHYPWTIATKAVNYHMNHHPNVLSYDHSRVKLTKVPGISSSDYYNASFIMDQHNKQAFIAAQEIVLTVLAK